MFPIINAEILFLHNIVQGVENLIHINNRNDIIIYMKIHSSN